MPDIGKPAVVPEATAAQEKVGVQPPDTEALSGEKAYEVWNQTDDGLSRALAEDCGRSLDDLTRLPDPAWDSLDARPLGLERGEVVPAAERTGLVFDEPAADLGRDWREARATVPYDHTWRIEDFDGVGDPAGAGRCWQLQKGNSCAVMSQVGVIEYVTGERLTEERATRIAQAHGWYDPRSGTLPENCGRMLDLHGIPNECGYGKDIADISQALDRGEQVIVGLDATAIWYPQRDADTGEVVYTPGGRGHAVWITGIDQDAQGNVTVIMNDTGHPDGCVRAVALEDFLAGWDAYHNFAVITHHGPSDTCGHA